MDWLREPTPSKEHLRQSLRTNMLFGRRITRLVEERRSEPRDDMVSRLVEADDQGDRRTPLEANGLLQRLLGAANRDPARFERPDELDFARADKRHLGFGRGVHYCLGARLARVEARVAFEVLLERFSDVQLDDSRPPVFVRGVLPRGPKHLHVRVRRPRPVAPLQRQRA